MFPFFTSRRRDKHVEESASITLKSVHQLPIVTPEVYATLAACVYNDISTSHGRQNHNSSYFPSSLSTSTSHAFNTQHVVLANVKNSSKCEDETVKIALPHGWQLFLTCKQFHLNRQGYFAAAFVNHSLHHCIVAQRGTCDVFGLRAGLWMYFDELTIQLFLAQQFSTELRKWLSLSVYSQYTISYTGHSLGALIAAIRALQEDVYAVTFEPPGCKPLIARLLGEKAVSAASGSIVSYLNQPNPINTLKTQCGLLIALPIVSQELPSGTLMLQVSNKHNKQQSIDSLLDHQRTVAKTQKCNPAATLSNDNNFNKEKQSADKQIKSNSKSIDAQKCVSLTQSTTSPIAVKTNKLSSLSSPRLRQMFTHPAWYKPLSLRDYAFSQTRGYFLSSVGIPQLQQYLSKIEPVIREMLQKTQQEHSIHNFVRYFAQKRQHVSSFRTHANSAVQTTLPIQKSIQKQFCNNSNDVRYDSKNKCTAYASEKPQYSISCNHNFAKSNDKNETIVICWPSSILQFVQYYNTIRALDDPANQPHAVHAAYLSMLNNLFKTAPLDDYQLPRCYLDHHSCCLWAWYTVYQQMLKQSNKTDEVVNTIISKSANALLFVPKRNSNINQSDAMYKTLHSAFNTLSKLQEKMLSVIHIDSATLSIKEKNNFTALEAKQFLSMLRARKPFAQLLKPSNVICPSPKL